MGETEDGGVRASNDMTTLSQFRRNGEISYRAGRICWSENLNWRLRSANWREPRGTGSLSWRSSPRTWRRWSRSSSNNRRRWWFWWRSVVWWLRYVFRSCKFTTEPTTSWRPSYSWCLQSFCLTTWSLNKTECWEHTSALIVAFYTNWMIWYRKSRNLIAQMFWAGFEKYLVRTLICLQNTFSSR